MTHFEPTPDPEISELDLNQRFVKFLYKKWSPATARELETKMARILGSYFGLYSATPAQTLKPPLHDEGIVCLFGTTDFMGCFQRSPKAGRARWVAGFWTYPQ